MAERHISVLKTFGSGDVVEWFTRFEICSKANGWTDNTKALKLPTLLEGEALAIWLGLTEEEQGEYQTAREKVTEKMKPAEFASLDDFHRRKLRPSEPIPVFVHELKKLLDQAMPKLDAPAREQLLLHQFLSGLPGTVSRQLRASGEMKTLQAAVDRTRLLTMLDEPCQTAAVAPKMSEVKELKEQIAKLTEQVATLVSSPSTHGNNTQQHERPPLRCFSCNRVGHIQRECPFRQPQTRRCFLCGRPGHLARDCWQGNEGGVPAKGSRRPNIH